MMKRVMYFRVGLVVLLLTSMQTRANEAKKSLSISPSTCITSQQQGNCQLDITLRVELPHESDFCVIAELLQFKQCYVATKYAEKKLRVSLSGETYFKLFDHHKELIAAQALSVAVLQPKKARPRRNLGWVLF